MIADNFPYYKYKLLKKKYLFIQNLWKSKNKKYIIINCWVEYKIDFNQTNIFKSYINTYEMWSQIILLTESINYLWFLLQNVKTSQNRTFKHTPHQTKNRIWNVRTQLQTGIIPKKLTILLQSSLWNASASKIFRQRFPSFYHWVAFLLWSCHKYKLFYKKNFK